MSYPQIPADFGFTEEHEVLRQSARRFLEERCPISEVRRLAESPLGHDPALWKEIAHLGWLGLVLPEGHGGAGLGYLHLALLLEETGRRLLPAPIFAAMLAGFALEAAGNPAQRARLEPALASGDLVATFALCDMGGGWEAAEIEATAEARDGGYLLRGVKPFVIAGAEAGLVIAPFRERGGELALFAVDLPSRGVRVESEIGVDPTRRSARLVFEDAFVSASARLDTAGAATLHRVHVRGFVALAAEMVGGAESTLLMTRDYAIARKQFDRQIGAFQAVKHPIVDVMIGVELARTHVLAAAAALDHEPDSAEIPARMAKAIASEVYPVAVRKAVQLHGGYGFTWDCDAHFYFKRALWSRAMLGDGAHHRRFLAADLLGPSA
ncbi:MAG TPA: acyl-CoA dehydrogenase [Myxococcota bacterium]|nr:acyl-CoA dehydrogenase [Myxococcota bacterium]